MNLVSTELNRRIASSLQYAAASERFNIRGKANFWRLVGLGVLLFGLGAGVGITFYGYSLISRSTANIDELTSAVTAALKQVTLEATASGTVEIQPHQISLASGQSILLDPKSRIGLDPNATVRADGDINVLMPPVAAPIEAARGQKQIPIIMNFTVFKSVPFEKGSVLTGWKFLTSAQQLPTNQYCYYTEKSDSSPLEPVVYIGEDERLTRPKQLPKDFDIKAAFAKCVWFDTGMP